VYTERGREDISCGEREAKGGEKIVLVVRVRRKRNLADNSGGDTKGRDSLYVEQNSVYQPTQLRILKYSNVNATRCEWLRLRQSNFSLSFVE
jgi:hypothetical protein